MHRTNPHFKFSASEKISIACCLVQAQRICTKITANTPLTRARGICTLHTRRFEKCIICMTRMTQLTLISASVAHRRPSTTKVTKPLFLSSIYINVLLKQRSRNEKGIGTEMHPAIVSGIVTGYPLVSYWPIFFLFLVTVPEVFGQVNWAQFPPRFLINR